MGQSSSSTSTPIHGRRNHRSTVTIAPEDSSIPSTTPAVITMMIQVPDRDYISDLPEEILAYVFHSLSSGDRKRCSLVCRQWLQIEGQNRHRISLDARSDLTLAIPALFSRFDSVIKLSLKCDRRFASVNDEGLSLISTKCRNLTRLKLSACREITDVGMLAVAKNCGKLKKFSCGSCNFGAKGMNALLENSSSIEEISVKRLRGMAEGNQAEMIGPGLACSSLKSICLKELYNGLCFGPLIAAAKNLRTLKIFKCSGDWDELLESISGRVTGLVEVHLERLQVSDYGLTSISNCLSLETLRLVKIPECTNAAIVLIAEHCKLLRKLHIDGWKTNRIGDQGLIAVAKNCPNIQELVLIGLSPTSSSLGLLGSCQNLQRLALCGSESIGDLEMSSIATKCLALKKLCIKGCPITNKSLEVLVGGCPKLVKVKVKKCRGVTSDGVGWLRSFRPSLVVNLDIDATENQDASASEDGPPESAAEDPSIANQIIGSNDIPSSSKGRFFLSRARLGIMVGRNFATCAFRRCSSRKSSGDTQD
ncbi:putative VIER F-box protein 1 [Ranunculus cassubicifolius]